MKRKIVGSIGITVLMFISINILAVPIECFSMDGYYFNLNEENNKDNSIDNSQNNNNDSKIKYRATNDTIYIYWTVVKMLKVMKLR